MFFLALACANSENRKKTAQYRSSQLHTFRRRFHLLRWLSDRYCGCGSSIGVGTRARSDRIRTSVGVTGTVVVLVECNLLRDRLRGCGRIRLQVHASDTLATDDPAREGIVWARI